MYKISKKQLKAPPNFYKPFKLVHCFQNLYLTKEELERLDFLHGGIKRILECPEYLKFSV